MIKVAKVGNAVIHPYITLYFDSERDRIILSSWVVRSDNFHVASEGELLEVSIEEFKKHGLGLIKKDLYSFGLRSASMEGQSSDPERDDKAGLSRMKKVDIELIGTEEARILILHSKNLNRDPTFLDETIPVSFNTTPEYFSEVVLGGLQKSKDLHYVGYLTWEMRAFLDVYRNDSTQEYVWFDWARTVPDPSFVEAWGLPMKMSAEEFRIHARDHVIKSVNEFPNRIDKENPNPNPRGSAVEDAGVATWKRLCIGRKDNPDEAVVILYNLDSRTSKQEYAGERIISLHQTADQFASALNEAFEICTVE